MSSFDTDSYTTCIENANKEYISELIINDAKVYLSVAKKSLKSSDYDLAYTQINKVSDSSEKSVLLKELDEVKKAIKEKEERERKNKYHLKKSFE